MSNYSDTYMWVFIIIFLLFLIKKTINYTKESFSQGSYQLGKCMSKSAEIPFGVRYHNLGFEKPSDMNDVEPEALKVRCWQAATNRYGAGNFTGIDITTNGPNHQKGCNIFTKPVNSITDSSEPKRLCWVSSSNAAPPYLPANPEPYVPPTVFYDTLTNCKINFDRGSCVTSNGIGRDENSGRNKIDSIDVGLNDFDRNIECYYKAKDAVGDKLTAVELISNKNNNGCYAHTQQVTKGNNSEDHICHVLSVHSTNCEESSSEYDNECNSLINRKTAINQDLQYSNQDISQENAQLKSLIDAAHKSKSNEYKENWNNQQSETNNELSSNLAILDLAFQEDSKDHETSRCNSRNKEKIQNLENEYHTLQKNFETYRLINQLYRKESSNLKMFTLQEDIQRQADEYEKKLQTELEKHLQRKKEIQDNHDETLRIRNEEEAARKQKEQDKYIAERTKQLQKLEEAKRIEQERVEEIANRELEIIQASADALAQAKNLAETKAQRDALEEARISELNKLNQKKEELEKIIEKFTEERRNLKIKIIDLKYNVEYYKEKISQTQGAYGKTKADLEDSALFTRQMQRIKPILN